MNLEAVVLRPYALVIMDKSCAYNYEYFQQEYVCRLCFNKNAVVNIFNNNCNKYDGNLINRIKDCLGIDLTDNKINPKKLCASCCKQIENFYVFKAFCQQNDKKLQEIMKNHNINESTVRVKKEKESNEELNLLSECENAKKPKSQPIVEQALVRVDSQSSFLLRKIAPKNCHKTPVASTVKIEDEEETQVSELENDQTSDNSVDTKPECRIKKVIKHKKRTPTYCNICRIDLDDGESFIKHNSEHHGIKDGWYQCFGCEKKFRRRQSRFCHEHNFCKGLADGYKCGDCGRYLQNRRHLEGHMRDHRRNVSVDLPEDVFKCRHCVRLFKCRDDLKKHVQEHGVGKKEFICEECGRVFTRQDYLHKHRLTHTGEKQHVCPHCDYRSTQRSSLVIHLRKHTGERPYSCDVCSQQCISSSNLRAHRRRHLGLKQHECTICGKRFGYKETLAEHVIVTHAPMPQACALCDARYTRPRALARHMRAKHAHMQGAKDVQLVQSESRVQSDLEQVQSDLVKVQNVSHVVQNDLVIVQNVHEVQNDLVIVETESRQVQDLEQDMQDDLIIIPTNLAPGAK